MSPDFSKATIDTLAKRAGFICSNPDCRVSTVGPNSEPNKYTTIGEAAHIYGARPNSTRYDHQMSDATRGEITNAIWLCSNCHTQIDRDPERFPATLLFAWREEHEQYVGINLGSASDRIHTNAIVAELDQFNNYPPIVRRIVIDKPPGWEWRLTAELLRHLNHPTFRQLHDLKDGLYTRSIEFLDDDTALSWVRARLAEMENLVPPLVKLLSRLSDSWGEIGQPGSVSEIHHVCLLIKHALEQIAGHEEKLHFVRLPAEYENIVELLKDCLGSQAQKFETIPAEIDSFLALVGTDHGGTADNPRVIEKIITFELPAGWDKQMKREIKKLGGADSQAPTTIGISWWSLSSVLALCWLLYIVVF